MSNWRHPILGLMAVILLSPGLTKTIFLIDYASGTDNGKGDDCNSQVLVEEQLTVMVVQRLLSEEGIFLSDNFLVQIKGNLRSITML